MALKLYNTLTRAKQVFEPLDPAHVRMYVCGPTVYDFAHIGNARPIIVFDVLYRLLKHLYRAPDHKVTYVRNITDVDDKINARAAEEGVSIEEVTSRTIKQFHADISALGVLEPDVEPRATEHVDAMIVMIEQLIAKGHAYVADGHVLFDVPSMPDYGQLSNRSTDDLLAGARVDVAPYKRDPMDFVLWKPSSDDLPGWDSVWGRGRPGWHIECSAMSEVYLGREFDIHGGGVDLVFPHHENEVAQSRCCYDTKIMARTWMHNGHLQVEGETMSKSRGNFYTINDQLRDWPGEVLRLAMLKTQYRQPFDWTVKGLKESQKNLEKWYDRVKGVTASEVDPEVIAALSDDLNTPLAFARMHQIDDAATLAASLSLLGFSLDDKALTSVSKHSGEVDEELIEALILKRLEARAEKNWGEADRLRDEIVAMGVVIMDSPEGTSWELSR
jgi:cysteinyl-tRNA synthetase